jgi:hypothetical protein
MVSGVVAVQVNWKSSTRCDNSVHHTIRTLVITSRLVSDDLIVSRATRATVVFVGSVLRVRVVDLYFNVG